ncbi:S-adenosylmethionine synthetase [Mycoplasmoides fastidiosum]|uniref:Methionine adenosyltransferase n=1 Tax=Mycoplasmoides fastidiosum TaxID=92758 RepID=A0ABU0LZ49_9BACT|nr:methionine adenosyltransferase [Mycoplasmoides fastidiosum]MDQ0513870.1 S-adenosylmethionine synthetase [Mycoplasmoides fastidiosum]UUD37716.1 methionine adenosyltransferase [Mycoplasmoides fastidiosum]
MNWNFDISSAESVGRGHPDKICDQIADFILDECLKRDPKAKVACEVLASNRLIVIGGEITTSTYVDVVKAAWKVLLDLGYNENDFTIISNVNKQSSDISQSVIKSSNEVSAGDQGIVYGFACNETTEHLPLAYVLATKIIQQTTKLIKTKKLPWAKYDMKSLVSLRWEKTTPILDSVIFSIQHDEKVSNAKIMEDIQQLVFDPIFQKEYHLNDNYRRVINSSGRFIIGGPIADTGLTNRKLMVDSYGGLSLHGGGGYSGKDPSKVDRTGAYLARWIAKNLVAAKICDWVEVKLVYALGIAHPINISLRFNQMIKYSHEQILAAIQKTFPLDLNDVIRELELLKPQYFALACYGHYGRQDQKNRWESIDKAQELIKNLNA